MSRGIAYGLAGGGLVVTLMALVYAQSKTVFLSPIFQWSLIVIYVVAMALPLFKQPPYETMEATRVALLAYLGVSACFYVYTFLLYEYFDPDLYRLQSELMIENAQRFQTGQPGKASEAVEELYAPEKLKYTASKVIYNYAIGALSGAAFAYLLGNLLGKKSKLDAQAAT